MILAIGGLNGFVGSNTPKDYLTEFRARFLRLGMLPYESIRQCVTEAFKVFN